MCIPPGKILDTLLYLYIIFKDKKSKRCHKTVEIKVDPDPEHWDPYICYRTGWAWLCGAPCARAGTPSLAR
jgi:hypothetical protein